MILREAPKLWPDCEAPRFVPACKPMIASLARKVSSENSRRFSSAGRGPSTGPLYSGCLYVYLIQSGNQEMIHSYETLMAVLNLRRDRWQKWSVWLGRYFCNPINRLSGIDQRLVLHILCKRVEICRKNMKKLKKITLWIFAMGISRLFDSWNAQQMVWSLSTFVSTQFTPGTQKLNDVRLPMAWALHLTKTYSFAENVAAFRMECTVSCYCVPIPSTE